MNIILLFASIGLTFIFFFLKKIDLNKDKTLKIFSIILFSVYLFRLFTTNDAINNVFNALLYDIETPVNSEETWIFSQGMTVFITLLRWFTNMVLILLVINPFFKVKYIKQIGAVLGVIVGVLNFVFFKEHLIAMEGEVIISSFKSIQYLVETTLFLYISMTLLLDLFKKKEIKIKTKEIYIYLLILVAALFATFPQTALYNLVGYYGEVADEFTNSHIAVIISPFILMGAVYLTMRYKSQEAKNALITFMAFAGFMQYLYMRRETLSALPLHLCNTAVILMLFAVVFRIKRFFYFSYFANVLGALAAIILPNYSVDLFSFDIMFIQAFIGGITAIVIPLGILPWWNAFSFIPLQSNLSHMLMIFMLVYAVKSQVWQIKFKRYYIAVISFLISALGIHLLNLYKYRLNPSSYSNYFWTRFPDPQFPLINSLEFPYHLIIIIGLALFLGLLSYLIGSAVSKISNNRYN